MATRIENAEDAICLLWYIKDELSICKKLCRQYAQYSFVANILEHLREMDKAVGKMEETTRERYQQMMGGRR